MGCRSKTAIFLAGFLVACAPTPPAKVSAPLDRLPSPASVHHDEPAGDASAPNDAALARLLDGKAGSKTDKFMTLSVLLPDRRNWRRIRVWGHPMRAVFRYGRKPYAVAFVDYRKQEDNSPFACLEGAAKRARALAERYRVHLAPFERALDKHWRGVESVDWTTRATLKRKKKTKVRRATPWRKNLKAARPKARSRPSPSRSQKRKKRLRLRRAGRRAFASRKPRPRYGYGPMPIIRLRGEFHGLFGDDSYRGALVAHRAWPGHCLVHGFGVREGSDEALAKAVVERWLSEWAPRLRWRSSLRAPPRVRDR